MACSFGWSGFLFSARRAKLRLYIAALGGSRCSTEKEGPRLNRNNSVPSASVHFAHVYLMLL